MNAYRTSPYRTGMTLVEVIASFALLLILSSVIFWILQTGQIIWQSSITRTAGRQELQVAAWRVAAEIRDARISHVTNNTAGTPAAFSFLSAYGQGGSFITDSTGAPVWQKAVVYYIPTGATKLLRREVYGTFTSALTTAQLTSYCNGQGTLLSPSITRLGLTTGASGAQSVTLSLDLSKKNAMGKLDAQSRQVSVYLRN